MINDKQINRVTFRRYKVNGVSSLNDKSRNYHLITFFLSGSAEYIIDGKSYLVSSGDILYVAPNQKRVRVSGTQGVISIALISFTSEEHKIFEENYFNGFVNEDVIKALELFEKAYKENKREKTLPLLEYLLADIKSRGEIDAGNTTVSKIKSFILSNAHQKITVDDISKHVFLSKIYCENIFKKATGQTLVTFINNEKVRLAKESLLIPEIPLVKIAEQLGFSDYNYFSRLFKKVTGISPLQYREQQRKIKR